MSEKHKLLRGWQVSLLIIASTVLLAAMVFSSVGTFLQSQSNHAQGVANHRQEVSTQIVDQKVAAQNKLILKQEAALNAYSQDLDVFGAWVVQSQNVICANQQLIIPKAQACPPLPAVLKTLPHPLSLPQS